MKGLILSGGKGTRLRPLTFTSAKQLVPVANKPVLFYGIEALVAAGVRDLGIVIGHTGDEIRAAVGDGSQWGAEVTYIPQDAPLGLAHAVKISRDFMADDPFVMYLGDNLVKDGITTFVDEFRSGSHNAQILLAKVANPQQFGVAELGPDGEVVRLEEKPAEPRSDLALVGVYLFDHNIFRAVDSISPSPRGELEITDAISWLIETNLAVRPHVIRGWWKDTGKVEDMLEANRIVLDTFTRNIEGETDSDSVFEGKVVLEPGAVVRKSVVRGPCIIGSGTLIESTFVGPYTAVQKDCRIAGCEIENSIVLEGSSLEAIPDRVEGSLIGRGVSIHRGTRLPKAYRFVVGDNSEVDIF
ncbi:MAG: glucose-1-phosphate thymidylyltransferase [bacterium]|nr:glucose-1-phosphate thymidylyltransferase [bacterium]